MISRLAPVHRAAALTRSNIRALSIAADAAEASASNVISSTSPKTRPGDDGHPQEGAHRRVVRGKSRRGRMPGQIVEAQRPYPRAGGRPVSACRDPSQRARTRRRAVRRPHAHRPVAGPRHGHRGADDAVQRRIEVQVGPGGVRTLRRAGPRRPIFPSRHSRRPRPAPSLSRNRCIRHRRRFRAHRAGYRQVPPVNYRRGRSVKITAAIICRDNHCSPIDFARLGNDCYG